MLYHISTIVTVQNGSNQWETAVAIRQPWTKVEGWVLPEVPPLITDILISLDDHFLYFSNWLRGDLVQYDISDPAHPRLASRIWLGGVARAGGAIKVTLPFFPWPHPVMCLSGFGYMLQRRLAIRSSA